MIDNSLKHGEKVTQVRLYYLKDPSEITLFYEDDGVGIPDDSKTKLFGEGFTTGGGTGLGLAMLRKILQVYGWSIKETGTPGNGARFEITIPAQ